MSVLSQSTLQPVPLHSRAVGKAFWGKAPCSPTGGTAAGEGPQPCGEPGAAHCRQPAGTPGGAEGLAPHEPEGCSAEHKGSPILAALPWNAAWEPLPSANLFLIIRPGCRLIPAPSPLAAQPRPARIPSAEQLLHSFTSQRSRARQGQGWHPAPEVTAEGKRIVPSTNRQRRLPVKAGSRDGCFRCKEREGKCRIQGRCSV